MRPGRGRSLAGSLPCWPIWARTRRARALIGSSLVSVTLVPVVTTLHYIVYTVRSTTTSTTFVTRIMGCATVESDLKSALSSVALSEAAIGDICNDVLSIISDAIDPGSRMGIAISSSHKSLEAVQSEQGQTRVCFAPLPRALATRPEPLRVKSRLARSVAGLSGRRALLPPGPKHVVPHSYGLSRE